MNNLKNTLQAVLIVALVGCNVSSNDHPKRGNSLKTIIYDFKKPRAADEKL